MRRTMMRITAIACAAIAICQAAQADTKIVERTTIDCPGLKSMLAEIPQQQRAPLLKMVSPILSGVPWITTTYLVPHKMRTDMGATSIIVDDARHRATTVNHKTHTYSIGPYDPFRKETGNMTADIRPATGSLTILGHKARRYTMNFTSSIMPKSRISGELWSAPDLMRPLSTGYPGGAAGTVEREMAKVVGLPLEYRLVYRNTPLGDIMVHSVATSISTARLPQSAFAVPAGYKRGATSTKPGMPSTGYPLGDGMPLDLDMPMDNPSAMGGSGTGALPEGLSQLLNSGDGSGLQGLTQSLGGIGGLNGLSQLLGSRQMPHFGQGLGGGASGNENAILGNALKSLQEMLKSLDDTGGE